MVLLFARDSSDELAAATAVGLIGYTALAVAHWQTAKPRWSICTLVIGAWLLYFPVRLLVLQSHRDDVGLNPVVRSASDGDLAAAWMLSLLGLAAFFVGARLVRRITLKPVRAPLSLGRSQFLILVAFGLVLQVALRVTGATSGIVENISLVTLFGIAGASFVDARSKRRRADLIAVVVVATLLGFLTGWKQHAIEPLIAWVVGALAGGLRVSWRQLVLLTVCGLAMFVTIQGARHQGLEGRRSGLLRTGYVEAFQRDASTGLHTRTKSIPAAVTNVLAGVSQRLYGADALIVSRARTPHQLPFLHGATIWQPALSVVPGVERLVPLKFNTLSNGRFFTTAYWSARPADDPSSQTITFPGDLYINFGDLGIVVGMAALGLLAGLLDARFPATTALGAGALAYLGTALASIESNVSYSVVTALIRLGVVALILGLLGIGERRTAAQSEVACLR
jgi:hypothetical protein